MELEKSLYFWWTQFREQVTIECVKQHAERQTYKVLFSFLKNKYVSYYLLISYYTLDHTILFFLTCDKLNIRSV